MNMMLGKIDLKKLFIQKSVYQAILIKKTTKLHQVI